MTANGKSSRPGCTARVLVQRERIGKVGGKIHRDTTPPLRTQQRHQHLRLTQRYKSKMGRVSALHRVAQRYRQGG